MQKKLLKVAGWIFVLVLVAPPSFAGELEPDVMSRQGCCACDGCSEGDVCTDGRSLRDCQSECRQRGCRRISFDSLDTCGGGCGSGEPVAEIGGSQQ